MPVEPFNCELDDFNAFFMCTSRAASHNRAFIEYLICVFIFQNHART